MDVSEHLRAVLTGRYEIEREIGAGGMATVYLARDLRHDRKVALKVLRPELGAVLGPERFLSEIRVTANLQHPHLLPLFDSGEADGLLFYVMPYVEGETLRDRLERERQLPVEEAVRIAVAVASALDYAHRHNVIHRDLKPENILLHEGEPLVTDFGIALAVSVAGGTRVTQTGLSLGTPQYMSPEQATGDRQIDARSDIYSLGAVLYEMLVGDPPHMASTVQAIIAKVLTDRPHGLRGLRETVPPHVDAAVMRALAKLPADRFTTAGEFGEVLAGVRPVSTTAVGSTMAGEAEAVGAPSAVGVGRRRLKTLGPWVAGALAGAAGVAVMGGLVLRLRSEAPARPAILEVTFADSVTPSGPLGVTVALSKDGAQLAFVGLAGGISGIFLRRVDGMEARLVRGTEGGISPTFSPDGEWILFYGNGTLRKVPAVGGAPITIADSGYIGASWGDASEVVFPPTTLGPLWRVSADGGPPTLLAAPDSARGHLQYHWPHVLPGGRAALITLWKRSTSLADAELGVVTIPEGEVIELGIQGSSPRYVSTGHVVFGRADGSIFAAPFSLRRLRATGPAVPALESVFVKGGGATEITVSDNGTMVFKPGDFANRQLVIVDRRGVAKPLTQGPAQRYTFPRISPDGRRIAVAIQGAQTDIWIYDLASTTLTRLTTDGGSDHPEWSPDGQRIAYVGGGAIRWQPWDGSGTPEVYLERNASDFSFGPPGSYLAAAGNDILIAPLDSPRTVRPFLATRSIERQPRVSPNGRLLAYISDESGRDEVYMRPLPGPGPRVQVSTAGGEEPVWAPSGRELFYRGPSHVMSATITEAPELAVVRRDTLFADPYNRGIRLRAAYDVFPNGQQFVMLQGGGGGSTIMAIVNWTEELRRRFRETPSRR